MRRRESGGGADGDRAVPRWDVREYLRQRGKGGGAATWAAAVWLVAYAWVEGLLNRLNGGYRLRREDREDLVQAVLAKVVEGLPKLGRGGSREEFEAWLKRVLHTTVVDLLRKKKRQRTQSLDDLRGTEHEPAARGPDPGQVADDNEQVARIRRALERRRGSDRPRDRVLVLRLLEGLQPKAIGALLTLKEKTVRDHLREGLRDVRTELGIPQRPRRRSRR
jgi:RNA polymerase sigma factor (sigma-70 family)